MGKARLSASRSKVKSLVLLWLRDGVRRSCVCRVCEESWAQENPKLAARVSLEAAVHRV